MGLQIVGECVGSWKGDDFEGRPGSPWAKFHDQEQQEYLVVRTQQLLTQGKHYRVPVRAKSKKAGGTYLEQPPNTQAVEVSASGAQPTQLPARAAS